MKFFITALLLLTLMTSAVVTAHGEEVEEAEGIAPLTLIYIASSVSGLFVLIALFTIRKLSEIQKMAVFALIALPVLIATVYFVFTTVSANITSLSGGPVHWHADYEVWACGEKIDIMDPEGFSNRIGSPVIHDHGDNRIHIEGVVQLIKDASLHSFFRSIGGSLTDTGIDVPTNQGIVKYVNGDLCQDGRPGALQAFVHKTANGKMVSEKLADFSEYVISPESQVPPGDCVIIEFTTEPTNKTDKLCASYVAAINKGDLNGG